MTKRLDREALSGKALFRGFAKKDGGAAEPDRMKMSSPIPRE
jgi:hypothetical protein